MGDVLFLTLAEVVAIHRDQVERYGGKVGIRSLYLLTSALAMPQASFGGEWLPGDLYEMAAAYAFHLCQNHPFWDGNKRTALVCALVFLELNGSSATDPERRLDRAMIDVASGVLDESKLADVLRSLPLD